MTLCQQDSNSLSGMHVTLESSLCDFIGPFAF